MSIRILDVGQCGFDGPRMAKLWKEKLGAKVDGCATGDEAVRLVGRSRFDVVLVNRVLAGDGSSGLEVIRELIESGMKTPVMLVSDHQDAQDEAEKLGAVRGFGKAELGAASTLELVGRVARGQ